MRHKLFSNLVLFFVYGFLAFPLFYFVYKFGDPEPLAHDFFQYYYLYKDFDIERVIAPHNMRLVGSFFVYLLYKLNIFYDTVVTFDKYQSWGFLKQVYFDAVLFNFLSVLATCLVLYRLLQKHLQDSVLAFIGSLFYLLGFGTLFYELMPLTDSFSVFLFALILYYYLDKKWFVVLLLAVVVFQREYILIVAATLAFLDYFNTKLHYYLMVALMSCFFMTIHLILRKTLFYTPHLDHQASLDYFFNSLMHLDFSFMVYLKQLAMTLNLFWLYIACIIYKKIVGINVDWFSLFKVFLFFFQINVICILAGHGTNCGRYFYIISPLVIFLLIVEIKPLLPKSARMSLS